MAGARIEAEEENLNEEKKGDSANAPEPLVLRRQEAMKEIGKSGNITFFSTGTSAQRNYVSHNSETGESKMFKSEADLKAENPNLIFNLSS